MLPSNVLTLASYKLQQPSSMPLWAVSYSTAFVLRADSCQELAKDPLPRLALFLVCQQALLIQL
jgi:hypothetical protein